tara:strand:+ start:1071 stop:1535 length:465 start_codon:yes stop_codon:yes gene_type:complete
MTTFIEFHIDFWHWWIIGVGLVGLEVFITGTYFLWMGISALIVGLLGYFLPQLGLPFEGLVFAVLSVVLVVGWRAYLKRHPTRTDSPGLNRRGENYIGRILTLSAPIKDGRGRTKLGDSTWRLEGPDLPAGTKIRITGIASSTLIIEEVKEDEH